MKRTGARSLALLICFSVAGLMVSSPAAAQLIHTVAGNGGGGYSGDGGRATDAMLNEPQGLAVGKDRSIYIADSANHRIRKVDAYGAISTVASNISVPQDIAIGVDGKLYVAGFNNVYAVSMNGAVDPLLSGNYGDSGDGGLAINASVKSTNGIAADQEGNIYFTDARSNKVRKISPNGLISTVAGNGVKGASGDGGPATSASLNAPYDVAADAKGNILIADVGNNRVRVVDPSGIISTPVADSSGVWFVEVDAAGRIYYGGYSSHVVKRLGLTDLQTVAGNNIAGFSGDGGAATAAQLHRPRRIAFDSAGNGYVADQLNNRIRKVVFGERSTWSSDFDGDGGADLIWRHRSDGRNEMWLNGNVHTSQAIADVPDSNWRIVGSGDFDGDGRSDIVWRNFVNGANTIWRSAQHALYQVNPVVSLEWFIAGVGDFDGDGNSDILWRDDKTGSSFVWFSGTPARQRDLLRITNLSWKIAGVGDFNGDGASDILWRNVETGSNVIWHSADYSDQRLLWDVRDMDWLVVGTGDFDGDGQSDILWRNSRSLLSTIWLSGDAARQQLLYHVTNPTWKMVKIGDFDADRRSDILWRNDVGGENVIWRSATIDQIPLATVVSHDWQIAP